MTVEQELLGSLIKKEKFKIVVPPEVDNDIVKNMVEFGINPVDRILHFGFCDNGLNFLENVEKIGLPLYYLGVDASDKVDGYVEKYKDNPTYRFFKQDLQSFLEDEIQKYDENDMFDKIILSGIFDKPVYGDKHYLFVTMTIDKCFHHTENVIFTLNTKDYGRLGYSMLYIINNLISVYPNVTIKKLDDDIYIFNVLI
jgi:hypothetical protein